MVKDMKIEYMGGDPASRQARITTNPWTIGKDFVTRIDCFNLKNTLGHKDLG